MAPHVTGRQYPSGFQFCSPSPYLTPRARGLGGLGPWRAVGRTRRHQGLADFGGPGATSRPRVDSFGSGCLYEARDWRCGSFHVFIRVILLGSSGQMSRQPRPHAFVGFFSRSEPPEKPVIAQGWGRDPRGHVTLFPSSPPVQLGQGRWAAEASRYVSPCLGQPRNVLAFADSPLLHCQGQQSEESCLGATVKSSNDLFANWVTNS